MNATTNTAITLARRPVGAPTADDFARIETEMAKPGGGEVLCRTIYLSLDPYMRGRMNDGPSYVPPTGIGDSRFGQSAKTIRLLRPRTSGAASPGSLQGCETEMASG